jgi:phage tail tape-measure protein
LDAVGAGGGGLAGAKAGACAGSLFGPIGTLIGGIVGGIGGAIGGRAITNEIKKRPLKKAIEEYQSNVSRMKDETRDKSRNMLQSINSFTTHKSKHSANPVFPPLKVLLSFA